MLPLGATQQILQSHNKPDFSSFQINWIYDWISYFNIPWLKLVKMRESAYLSSATLDHTFSLSISHFVQTLSLSISNFFHTLSPSISSFYSISISTLGTNTFNFHFSSKFQGLLNLKSGGWTFGLLFVGLIGVSTISSGRGRESLFGPGCKHPEGQSSIKIQSQIMAQGSRYQVKAHTVQISQNVNLKTTREQYS